MVLSGWVKVHRALSDHLIASDPASFSIWIHLLLLANHAETKRQINGRVIVLQPGQLITSRKSLAAKTGVNESKVERVLSMLKSEQQIEQHGSSKFRLISILNWAEYQSGEQQNEQQVNSTRTTDEQQMNTPEEVSSDTKNVKNGKNVKTKDESGLIGLEQLVAEGCSEQHAKDWLKVRKTKKAPLTSTAWEGMKREAGLANITVARAVQISAESAWIGFKAEWMASAKTKVVANGRHSGFDNRDYEQGLTDNGDGTHGF